MNKKGGVPSTLVMVWSLIIWALLIIAFIILFQLTANIEGKLPGEIDKNSSLIGELNPKVQLKEEMLTYLKTPIKHCSFAQEKNVAYDLTYAEMIRLFMKGKPKIKIATFSDDTKTPKIDYGRPDNRYEHEDAWGNSNYIKYMYVWDVCTDHYFNGEDSSAEDVDYVYQLGDSKKEIIFDKLKGVESMTKKAIAGDFQEDSPAVPIYTTEGKIYFTLIKK